MKTAATFLTLISFCFFGMEGVQRPRTTYSIDAMLSRYLCCLIYFHIYHVPAIVYDELITLSVGSRIRRNCALWERGVCTYVAQGLTFGRSFVICFF